MTANDSSSPRSPAQLIAEITSAFDGVSRGDGTTLHEGEEIDCHGSPAELLAARQLDTDTRWQEVPDQWIAEFPSAFMFMDAKGLRYYLPALILWGLKTGEPRQSWPDDNVFALLLDASDNRHRALFELLNDAQRRAVAKWLLFYSTNDWHKSHEEAVAGLKASSWGQYVPM